MQDTKLFETILGITTPWHITRVELKTEDKRVDLWLEHEPTRWPCPECGTELAGFDHAEERTWRHLDTCQFQTHLHAEIPRVQCPTHGVKQVRVPWAEPRSRFTLLMERLVIDLILQCSTVKGACAIAAISWDEAWGIMQRAVTRGQGRKEARPIVYIGVDEKAFRKGHRYHTVVCDLERSTVEFVAADRKTESLAAYYEHLTDAQTSALQAVAMDMWGAVHRCHPRRPAGRRVADCVRPDSHIMREMTKAVDTVRKQEHRAFLKVGEDSPLTGTKYLWLFSDERRAEYHADTFATLQALNLKVGRAWAIQEALRTLWTYRRLPAVTRFFKQWYGWAVRSRLKPVKQVAAMLKRHLDGVRRFVKHPITNCRRGTDSKIMSIKRKAGGFRNPSNFTTAIYFHCGGSIYTHALAYPVVSADPNMLTSMLNQIAGTPNPAIRCRRATATQPEQRLKRRHRLPPAVVAERKLVEVNLKLGLADARDRCRSAIAAGSRSRDPPLERPTRHRVGTHSGTLGAFLRPNHVRMVRHARPKWRLATRRPNVSACWTTRHCCLRRS